MADATARRRSTGEREQEILSLLDGTQMHTVEIAERLGLSHPRTRQLVGLLIDARKLRIAGTLIDGKGRPKRLLSLV
jgi:predicted ArsR family transcriptional regulator